ncbi:MAG: type II toxin-antitoxin system VapC family toxin [Coriobacteriales bacterium]|jgi:PIN domain nuclease of toxin-antitoxin system|nr:type II toxin-antitoxin system VapC family toxin [Coriobacteriales bacterium]
MGFVSAFGDHRGYLLDTHTFFWATKNPERLGNLARQIIENPQARLYLSSISAFEAANKQRLGKLDASYGFIVENYTHVARQLGVEELPLTLAHTYLAGTMEWEHRDPFDRFLVAQASLENLALISDDAQIKEHFWVDVIW